MKTSKVSLFAALLLSSVGTAFAQTASVQLPGIVKTGAVSPKPGPAKYFTGKVTVAELVKPTPPGRAGTGLVAFQPGARSNWHTHPAGQTLYVTDGCG
jgi:quercetin dioxygenase-like cupin family protein